MARHGTQHFVYPVRGKGGEGPVRAAPEAGSPGCRLRQNANRPVDVFIVDADPWQRRVLASLIAERAGGRFHAHACASRGEALAAAARMPGAIMIVDLETIGGAGRLAEIARAGPR